MANQKSIEAGQQSLGIPLWGNPWRYLINSPVFHLHRVQTPVLLIQGDQDFPGTRPSEEVFTGLYRLGKRARFVRYWGEQHSIDSPANIRDVWARILAWLDETLNATPPRGLQ
jgi:dipeptidyl aminopeptidase/acylaminoacyl peptidase